ncbi:MAG: hypothetical protein WBG80_03475, partial [Bacteroidota bacterium]
MRRLTNESARLVASVWRKNLFEIEELAAEHTPNQLEAGNREVRGKARTEQPKLRKFLLGGRENANCFLCGRNLSASLLVAAHIKPRRECSPEERRDLSDVALMCRLGCDSLFELGFITVRDGRLTRSSFAASDPTLSEYTAGL